MRCGKTIGHGMFCSGETDDPYLCGECKKDAEIARLRGLIEQVEHARPYDSGGGYRCPWCGLSGTKAGGPMDHTDDCPAFSAPGVVRGTGGAP